MNLYIHLDRRVISSIVEAQIKRAAMKELKKLSQIEIQYINRIIEMQINQDNMKELKELSSTAI